VEVKNKKKKKGKEEREENQMPLLMCEWVVLFSLFSLLFTLSIFCFPFTTALSFPFFSSSKTPKNPHFLFSNTKLVKVGLTCY